MYSNILTLYLLDNPINLLPQHLFPRHDLRNLRVELHNVDLFPGVLLLYIGGNGQVIALLRDFVVWHQPGEMRHIRPLGKGGYDGVDILRGQLVAVRHLDALLGGVDEQGGVVRLGFFQHHDAGGDAGAEEQVVGKLNNTVDEDCFQSGTCESSAPRRPGTSRPGSRRWPPCRWWPATKSCAG